MSRSIPPWLAILTLAFAACGQVNAQEAERATSRERGGGDSAPELIRELRARIAELERRVERLEESRRDAGEARRRGVAEEVRRRASVPAAPETSESEIKIFNLENADAVSIADTLRPLFATTDPRAVFGGRGGRVSAATVTIAVDQRTNTLIARGPLDELKILDAILARLDSETKERAAEQDERARRSAPTVQ